LDQPPWKTTIDLGTELAPHELTVIAFDEQGQELGRDTQALNIAHPPAELGILLERKEAGELFAQIRFSHYAWRSPRKVVVKLDGRTIHKGGVVTNVSLGWFRDSAVHVLGVEATFPDGIRSRKELAFGGIFAEQMPAELTPVAVRMRGPAADGAATCFRTADGPLPPAPIERGAGAVHFIINGRRNTDRDYEWAAQRDKKLFALPGNDIVIVNPVAQEILRTGGYTFVFDSEGLRGTTGTRRVVLTARAPLGTAQIAGAIGVAGLRALSGGERRVVVLAVGDSPARDYSRHKPAVIRRYLERIGVPFRVWSLTGPRPDLAETWGEVRDVSTAAGLLAATDEVRRDLESQRVAWLPVGPLDALRVIASDDCAYAPLAHGVR
jgi:hypothetical protein